MVIHLSKAQVPSSPHANSVFRNEPKYKFLWHEHENTIKNNTSQKV